MTQEEERIDIFMKERNKNTKKLILIENLENINLSKNKKIEFIKFYYSNLDMGLEEAISEFKKK